MAYHAGAGLANLECHQINPLIKDDNGPACAYVAGPFGPYTANSEGTAARAPVGARNRGAAGRDALRHGPGRRLVLRVVSLAASLAAWHLAASGKVDLGVVSFRNVPTPIETARAALTLFRSPTLWLDLGASLARVLVGELLLKVWSRNRTTILFVTHNIDEALFLADRIVVMTPRPGRILDDLRIDFARPRQRDLISDPRFTTLKRHCLTLLHTEPARLPLARLTPIGVPGAVGAD